MNVDYIRSKEDRPVIRILRDIRNIVRIWKDTKLIRTLIKMWKTNMTAYPTQLPLDAVQKLIEIVKTKAIQERKAEFGLAAWNVQGYAQSMLLGNPLAQAMFQQDDTSALDELALVLVEHQQNGMTFSAQDEQEQLDLNSIMTVLTVILELLKSLGILKFKS